MYVDASNLYGLAMSEYLPYDENKFDGNVELEDILNTPYDSDIGYFIKVDLKDPDNKEHKTKNFTFALVNEKKLFLLILVISWKRLYLILIHKLENWYVITLIGKVISFIIGC